MNTSETPRFELERLYGNKLVAESFLAWQVLTKAIEKERGMSEMVMGIGSPSEAWRALTKIAAETREAAYDRAKSEFELLEIEESETVVEYFDRVHVVYTKLTKHEVATPRPRDKT